MSYWLWNLWHQRILGHYMTGCTISPPSILGDKGKVIGLHCSCGATKGVLRLRK